ncbi:hypothetical protein J4E89_000723 [Alternaria sp. Ai002NY15]|nr:hypothetical protein J4E89_000723 [Alternaria sp. Ai002NY15]
MSPSLSGLGLASPGPSDADLADFTRRFEQFQLYEDEKAKFMTFSDDFLREGEQGGRRAAVQLFADIHEYIENECQDIPFGYRIACRIYANVRGLGDVLVRRGMYEDIIEFEDFVRGFTRGKTLFDFIDVGAGKDRADEKIIGLFRETKLVVWGSGPTYAASTYANGLPPAFVPGRIDSNDSSKASVASTGLPSRFPAPSKSPIMDSPLPNRATMMALPRTPSTSTLASDSTFPALKPDPPAPLLNWAAKAAAPPPPVTETPVYKPANREEVIARNRAGQRVDPPCKDYDKAEVDRMKKIKLCNVHFLRAECPYDTKCTHLHAYKPTSDELATLRLVARMAPCSNGSVCQDIRCIYGHRCPAPPNKIHYAKGTKSCIFGESCKFPASLHDIDTNVVKTLVVR